MQDNTNYVVAPDIERARSLPGAFYLDPAVWAAQRRHLFAESWHVLLEDVGAGEVVPTNLLPGALDEPLLLLNDEGVTRCFSNVCTHRGAILVEQRKL
ncbi:MAG: Rieske 2Fe-2S domain-containing protein, partial [Myxococcales bacterium]|nr:Rieske 2Fe-2S domain-containing protein [Myxococcales bacterium]